MHERIIFALSVLLIVGGYQCYWINQAIRERRKWANIVETGGKYMGTVASVDHDYARYGERLNVHVRLNVPDKGDILLRNWPVIRHCPYAAGSETEVLWSPNYPHEFIFADEAVWQMRGLNPVIGGRFKTGIFKFRFFLTWAIAAAIIIFGFAVLNILQR